MTVFFDTFYLLLKYMIKFLLILPLVMFIIGMKSDSKLYQDLAIKLFIIGLCLAIILLATYFLDIY